MVAPERELKLLLGELGGLRAEIKRLRGLLKGDAVALEALLELARENADLNARLQ